VRSSTREFAARVGSLSVDETSNATEAFDAATRAVYLLRGNQSSTSWNLGISTSTDAATSIGFPLSLDAAGNHHAGSTWYGVSGDGQVLLGTLSGADTAGSLGILIGLK
jgi:hypothetical protein